MWVYINVLDHRLQINKQSFPTSYSLSTLQDHSNTYESNKTILITPMTKNYNPRKYFHFNLYVHVKVFLEKMHGLQSGLEKKTNPTYIVENILQIGLLVHGC
jgi:hypothetical protein